MQRWSDWIAQAQRDIEHAEASLEKGFYEWACFSSQQSAEKAVKAVYIFQNKEARGHSISLLLQNLSMKVPEEIIKKGAKLDRFYIPTRYANSFETGSPKDYFFKDDAEEAIKYAREIIQFCKNLLHK